MVCFVLAVAVADVVLELETPILIKLGSQQPAPGHLVRLCGAAYLSPSHISTLHTHAGGHDSLDPLGNTDQQSLDTVIIRSTINKYSNDPCLLPMYSF